MKKLKFLCPFGGKVYPIYIVAAIFFLAPLLSAANGSFIMGLIGGTVLALGTFAGSFFIEQHLSDSERAIVESTEMPLWEQAPPELLETIRKRTYKLSGSAIAAIVVALFMLMSLAMTGDISAAERSPIYLILFAALIVLLVNFIHGAMWRTIDESARFILVPVHHTYTIEHHNKDVDYLEYYHVLYLPDGRYILHAKGNDIDAQYVNIVKYRNMVTWLPYQAPLGNNSDYAFRDYARAVTRVSLKKTNQK